MIKRSSIVVGGKVHIKSSIDLVQILKAAGIKIKAIDPLGTDIDAIVAKTDQLDFLLLERSSSISTRLRLAKHLKKRSLKCNIIMFHLHKDVTKTKFYKLFTLSPQANKEFEQVLADYFNTTLRTPCKGNVNKLKYLGYTLQQTFLDIRSRWARKYYASFV
jgi:hypothetical protein